VNAFPIAIGSSFSAEPLRSPLERWLNFLGHPANLLLVPYGQMLRHLVDRHSPWHQNQTGFNVVFVRPSDFTNHALGIRYRDNPLEEFLETFARASQTWTAHTLVLLAPSRIDTPKSNASLPCQELETELEQRLKTTHRIDVKRVESLFDSYRCLSPNDAFSEHVAHIPWNDSAWLAIASAISRFIDSKLRTPLKAIVVDCDNTLWNGVCGEDGPQGIHIESRHAKLQNMLLEQRSQGRLICLCSKNNPDDVWNIFESRSDMILKRHHITAARLNWMPKSTNLLQLSGELNLSPDSFLFLDDNPLEIGEVRANVPEIISIVLPDDSASEWSDLLNHLWPLDGQSQTGEDLKRAQRYQEEAERSALRTQVQTLPDFLSSLNIVVDIQPLMTEDRPRSDQLLQRTNQFNIRPSVRTLADLTSLLVHHELEIHTVRCQDRLGDYGLVGLMVSHCEGSTIHLDHLVLSCRALGRTVEIIMLQHLARLAHARWKSEMRINFEASTRNRPAFQFLSDISGQTEATDTVSTIFSLDVEYLLSIDPVDFASQQKQIDDAGRQTTAAKDSPILSQKYQKIAELNSTDAVDRFHRSLFSRKIERLDAIEYPSTDLEKRICAICENVLYLNDLGLSDSFREIGCSSLQFIRICAHIKSELGISLAVAETFGLGTLNDLAQLVKRALNTNSATINSVTGQINFSDDSTAPRTLRRNSRIGSNNHDIAIIGMAGRFPGADDINSFWNNLRQGIESIETLSEAELNIPQDSPLRNNPNLVRRASYLKGADQFDARFFGVFPKEAASMDPQHRLLLEEAYHALEDAGYIPDQINDAVGVFAGCYMDTYVLSCLESYPAWIQGLANSFHGGDLLAELGNDKDYLATRISFLLNLRGPALTVQTACSTSLVAIIQACQSLHSQQCRMALAGGVTLKFPQKRGYLYTEGGMVSPEGKCRTFDANAKGTIFGEGVAVVVLKRLEDAIQDGDSVYAVIRGWGLNNDGRSKSGYAAPSVSGQTEAIALAHQHANVSADTIEYVEAHGTGTAMGDPIEIEALTQAFRRTSHATQYCRIGSAKTNIGHLDVAAGACGLIKATLSLQHELIPASLHFDTPNPNIDFVNSPFVVNSQPTAWPRNTKPRRAGISSFGVGGTNAHVIIEDLPVASPTATAKHYHLLCLSARSESALCILKQRLLQWIQTHPDAMLADICYTLTKGRKRFNHSWTAVVSSTADAVRALSNNEPTYRPVFSNRKNVPVAFVFPGQGSQHIEMGYELYKQEPHFTAAFDRCCELLLPHLKFNLRDAIFPKERADCTTPLPPIDQTIVAQPAIFSIAYATTCWLQSLGLTPQALIGHSVGEFVAACISGIFQLEDALSVIAFRAQCMQHIPPGHMLAVRVGKEALTLSPSYQKHASRVSLAAVNSPNLTVLAGECAVIELLQHDFESEGIVSKVLKTSHAFHSWMMDPAVTLLKDHLQQIRFGTPKIPIISSVTGNWLSNTEAISPEYWASHLRNTVDFSTAAETLFQHDFPILLEVGPGQTLTTCLMQQKPDASKVIIPLFPHIQQETSLQQHAINTLGRLWQQGAHLDLPLLYSSEMRQRLHLPGYPFERQRYWFDQLFVADESKKTPTHSAGASDANQAVCSDSIRPLSNQDSQSDKSLSTTGSNQNDEYSQLVQHVIRQQLHIMSQQLKLWQT